MPKKRILLIDDEAAFTRLLKLNLEQTGHYEVRIENRAKKALAAARQFRPDLIFLDIVMPGMDGSAVAAEIKADAMSKHVPIVFLTAAVLKEEVDQGGGIIGGHPFLAKPISGEDIIEYLKKHLKGDFP